MDRITVRIPGHIYKKLKEIQIEKPHLSLNALIVEAITKSLTVEVQAARQEHQEEDHE